MFHCSERTNLENWRPDNFFLQVSAVTAFAIGGTLAAMRTGKREGQIYIRANQMTVYENKIHASVSIWIFIWSGCFVYTSYIHNRF